MLQEPAVLPDLQLIESVHTGGKNTKKTLLILGIIVLSVYTLFIAGVLAGHFLGSLELDNLDGRSMQPTLNDGDLVCVVRTDTAKIQPGDIIAFQVPELDIRVCHRVIEIRQTPEGQGFITQGDGNYGPDEWIVYPRDVEGKILANFSLLRPLFNFIKSLPGVITSETVIFLLVSAILVPRIRLDVKRRRARRSETVSEPPM